MRSPDWPASLGGIYLYGIKTDHHHARETGELELETLVNTFLIYTPMQLIVGRQRPGEGNGQGDFFKHHALNTSFPGGHAMFTWAMASVLADEYPKPWARVLSYGAAFTVTFTRFMARDHWSSDIFLGTGLGLAIAENTFHARCDPQYPSQCKHHQRWWKVMKAGVAIAGRQRQDAATPVCLPSATLPMSWITSGPLGATPTFPPPRKLPDASSATPSPPTTMPKHSLFIAENICFVILNAYPYTPGHVMIVPYAHLDELRKLPAEAASEMMALSQRMESVLRELYTPMASISA